ncbi:MAG: flippase, partial [Vicinamibacterales bacterium]
MNRPSTTRRRPARRSLRENVVALLSAQCLTWGITAVTMLIISRYLGPSELGKLSLAGTFTGVAGAVASLGLPTLVTRDVSRHGNDSVAVVSAAAVGVLLFSLLSAVGTVALALALGYGGTTLALIVIGVAALPLTVLFGISAGVIQGLEAMRYQAVLDVLGKLVGLAIVGAAVGIGLNLIELTALTTLAAFATGMPMLYLAWRYIGWKRVPPALVRDVSVRSMPFFVTGIFLLLYVSSDILMLSLLSGDAAVGYYSAPFRVFSTLLFIPNIIATAIFPRLAAVYEDTGDHFGGMAAVTLRVVLIASTPVALLSFCLFDRFISTLLGHDFSRSGAVGAIFAISVIPTGISVFTSKIALSANRERAWTVIMGIALASKVGLALWMIPLFDRQ